MVTRVPSENSGKLKVESLNITWHCLSHCNSMSNVSSNTYKSDIAELERLSGLTERESVKSHIDDLLTKLRKQLDRAQEVEKEQELKAIEKNRLEEERKKREASLAAQGKSIPQPIGRSAASITFISSSFAHVLDTVLLTHRYRQRHRIFI